MIGVYENQSIDLYSHMFIVNCLALCVMLSPDASQRARDHNSEVMDCVIDQESRHKRVFKLLECFCIYFHAVRFNVTGCENFVLLVINIINEILYD